MTKRPVIIFGIILPLVTIIIDQITKYWVIGLFKAPYNICETNPYPGLHREFSPIFDLSLVCNQGVSFGMLSGDSSIKRWLLTIFAAVMCTVLFYALTKSKDNLTRFSLGIIIGGAIGNGIDRVMNGAVTDFVNVTSWLPVFPWIFNVADAAITIGVIGLILASFIFKPDDKPAAQSN